jgi:transcriptional regulator with XRE-family HTH domain
MDLREKLGVTRPQLVERSGVSLSWLKYIELQHRQPSGLVAYAIAKALNVNIDTFTTPLTSTKRAA